MAGRAFGLRSVKCCAGRCNSSAASEPIAVYIGIIGMRAILCCVVRQLRHFCHMYRDHRRVLCCAINGNGSGDSGVLCDSLFGLLDRSYVPVISNGLCNPVFTRYASGKYIPSMSSILSYFIVLLSNAELSVLLRSPRCLDGPP